MIKKNAVIQQSQSELRESAENRLWEMKIIALCQAWVKKLQDVFTTTLNANYIAYAYIYGGNMMKNDFIFTYKVAYEEFMRLGHEHYKAVIEQVFHPYVHVISQTDPNTEEILGMVKVTVHAKLKMRTFKILVYENITVTDSEIDELME